MPNRFELTKQIALTRRQATEQERAVISARARGQDTSSQVGELYRLLDQLTDLEVARDRGAAAV
jgi:hypothetical protein